MIVREDYWDKFDRNLLRVTDKGIRLLGLKMIEQTVTLENLDEILRNIEQEEFDETFDDVKYKHKIKSNIFKVIENQSKLTQKQTIELHKRIRVYRKTGCW